MHDTDEQPSKPTDRQDELVLLLTQHRNAIFAFIYSLVPNRSDAEDILQETSLTIFRKFDEFETGTDFPAWAKRIAYWTVMQTRKKYARSQRQFSEAAMDALAETQNRMTVELDHRHKALEVCLHKLKERDRNMILARYKKGNRVEDAARTAGRSLQAAYKALGRLRKSLAACVDEQMKQWHVDLEAGDA